MIPFSAQNDACRFISQYQRQATVGRRYRKLDRAGPVPGPMDEKPTLREVAGRLIVNTTPSARTHSARQNSLAAASGGVSAISVACWGLHRSPAQPLRCWRDSYRYSEISCQTPRFGPPPLQFPLTPCFVHNPRSCPERRHRLSSSVVVKRLVRTQNRKPRLARFVNPNFDFPHSVKLSPV